MNKLELMELAENRRHEIDSIRYLLRECLRHVESQAASEHILDGLYGHKHRPIDDLVDKVREAIK
jgi:hypothetical protein